MAHSFGTDETASSSFSIDSLDAAGTSFWEDGYELELQWGRIERLATVRQVRSSFFRKDDEEEEREVIDVTNLGALERHVFIKKLITKVEEDNLRLLKKLRERIDGVGLELPIIEVRYQNLSVEAECEVVHGRPLPTLWNSFKGLFSYWLSRLAGVAMSSATVLFAPGPAFGHWVFKKSAWLGSKDGSWG